MSKPIHILRRQRRKKSTEEVKSELDMTSMIDVVFLLLIFFMCATKFKDPEGSLRSWLPRDRGTGKSSSKMIPGARITLQRDGNKIICWADQATVPFESSWDMNDTVQASQYYFEAEYGIQGPDLDAVTQHLQLRKDTYSGVGAKGLPVIIDFAEDVPSRYVVDIVNICKALKIDDVAFAAPELPYE